MNTIQNNYRRTKCPFCNSDAIQKTGDLKYSGDTDFSTHKINLALIPEVWKCKSCNSSFTQNAILPDVAEELYAQGEGSKRWSSVSFEKDKTDDVINHLEKYLRKDIKLLDVGCNTGEFLDYSKQKNAKTFGLEICGQSCEIVRGKGHQVFQYSKEIKETFDVITAFDVVEHLYDPNGFFSFINQILNPSGFVIILTGNPDSSPAKFCKEKWWYLNYPEHVIFPSPSYFKNVNGFEFIDQWNVYASKSHEKGNIIFKLKDILLNMLAEKYSGLPAYSPDHQLVVIQKKA